MALEMRPIAPDEYDEWLQSDSMASGAHLSDGRLERLRTAFDVDRSLAVFDRGTIVGAVGSTLFEMAVPGGSLSTAGVLAVSVQPTHRRRGLLTRMTAQQLIDVRERGEPLAALFASESIIYGRFGYGNGTIHERWSIDRQHTAYTRPYELRGRISFVGPQEMREVFPDVFRRSTVGRPGAIQREEYDWDDIVEDPEDERGGGSAYFHIVYEHQGTVDGYASYRTKEGTLLVQELMAATDEAHAALWRFCFDVDLMSSTEAYHRPVDDPLPWMLADPRRLKRSPYDALWVRLVDVRAALSGRRYMRSDRLVLEVRDEFCPWNEGRYELEGGPDGALCSASDGAADIVLSAADLATTYLGTARFTTLSHAGRVEEQTRGALERADAMFATELAPWCPYGF